MQEGKSERIEKKNVIPRLSKIKPEGNIHITQMDPNVGNITNDRDISK